MKVFELVVPDDINIDALRQRVDAFIVEERRIFAALQHAQERATRCERALESDEGLREWAAWEGVSLYMVVRASVYRNSRALITLHPFDRHDTLDPRRPVYMRGSLHAIFNEHKYNRPDEDWCGDVVLRYLRRIRYTCFDRDQYLADMDTLRHANIFRRFRFTSYVRKNITRINKLRWAESGPYATSVPAWIDGEFLQVKRENLASVKALRNVVIQIDKKRRGNGKQSANRA